MSRRFLAGGSARLLRRPIVQTWFGAWGFELEGGEEENGKPTPITQAFGPTSCGFATDRYSGSRVRFLVNRSPLSVRKTVTSRNRAAERSRHSSYSNEIVPPATQVFTQSV